MSAPGLFQAHPERCSIVPLMGFHLAQICENGHLIHAAIDANPDKAERFCSRCGRPTLIHCPSCQEKIRGVATTEGRQRGSWVIVPRMGAIPAFCHSCGNPFPWTEKVKAAVRDFAAVVDGLNDTDRKVLTDTVDDIVRESPQTPVTASKWKKILTKLTPGAFETLRGIMIEILSETAKKVLFP